MPGNNKHQVVVTYKGGKGMESERGAQQQS